VGVKSPLTTCKSIPRASLEQFACHNHWKETWRLQRSKHPEVDCPTCSVTPLNRKRHHQDSVLVLWDFMFSWRRVWGWLTVFWDAAPSSLVEDESNHRPDDEESKHLWTGNVGKLLQTTWRNIPEDGNIDLIWFYFGQSIYSKTFYC
jgi:hypothetical protein